MIYIPFSFQILLNQTFIKAENIDNVNNQAGKFRNSSNIIDNSFFGTKIQGILNHKVKIVGKERIFYMYFITVFTIDYSLFDPK